MGGLDGLQEDGRCAVPPARGPVGARQGARRVEPRAVALDLGEHLQGGVGVRPRLLPWWPRRAGGPERWWPSRGVTGRPTRSRWAGRGGRRWSAGAVIRRRRSWCARLGALQRGPEPGLRRAARLGRPVRRPRGRRARSRTGAGAGRQRRPARASAPPRRVGRLRPGVRRRGAQCLDGRIREGGRAGHQRGGLLTAAARGPVPRPLAGRAGPPTSSRRREAPPRLGSASRPAPSSPAGQGSGAQGFSPRPARRSRGRPRRSSSSSSSSAVVHAIVVGAVNARARRRGSRGLRGRGAAESQRRQSRRRRGGRGRAGGGRRGEGRLQGGGLGVERGQLLAQQAPPRRTRPASSRPGLLAAAGAGAPTGGSAELTRATAAPPATARAVATPRATAERVARVVPVEGEVRSMPRSSASPGPFPSGLAAP